MQVVIVEPGKEPYTKDIENELKAFQNVVGGWIETVNLTGDFILICNEEGKLNGLPPNRDLGFDVIVGTFLVVGEDGEEFRGLSDEECKKVLKHFALN